MSATHDSSLAQKNRFFSELKNFWGDSDDDDDFDSQEAKRRHSSRAFFCKAITPRDDALDIVHDANETLRRTKQPARENRTESATSPPPPSLQPLRREKTAPQIIQGTPAGVWAEKTRLGELLNRQQQMSGQVDETPKIDSADTLARSRLLGRSDSTPLPSSSSSSSSKRLLDHGSAGESPSMAAATTARKRRKKETEIKMRPEQEQIFRGLKFFYVPNDDIAPARRMRITRARERGATWTRDIGMATHVVAEKNLTFKDVEGLIARCPAQCALAVVNEDYPIDCIQFRAVLDPNQSKYTLRGQPLRADDSDAAAAAAAAAAGQQPPTFSEESNKSLPLKAPQRNPRRWDYVPPPGTPSRSEESSQRSRGISTAVIASSQPIAVEKNGESRGPQDDQTASLHHGTSITTRDAYRDTPGNQEPTKDELSDYITILQEYKDLPLDHDEEGGQPGADTVDGQSSDAASDEEPRLKTLKKKRSTGRKDVAFEDRFACNQATSKDSGSGNPNARTIEILQSMADYYERVNDHWRTTGYRKAIHTLKRQSVRITSEEEAFRLPNIGQRIAQKIEEIVMTDGLQRLEYAQNDPTDASLQLFLKIYGVGTRQAQQWIAQGLRSLEDVRQKAKLSTNQLMGIEHYDDLNTRIPRAEVEALGAVVKETAARVDKDAELIIGGSYRRGADSSGDIDFIVTKAGTESCSELRPLLDRLVGQLEQDGFLVACLASSRSASDGSKWHGCCVLPRAAGTDRNSSSSSGSKAIWRRIDFLLVPSSEMGAALIYFTGNDIFNRSMRLLASKKGMRLNQRGLYRDVLRGAARAKVTEGELVEGRDERRIFEVLGVKWRGPHERWC